MCQHSTPNDWHHALPTYIEDTAVCSAEAAPVLEQETAELSRIIDHKFPQYESDDPLDLGEAFWLAHWFPEEEWSQVDQLISQRHC